MNIKIGTLDATTISKDKKPEKPTVINDNYEIDSGKSRELDLFFADINQTERMNYGKEQKPLFEKMKSFQSKIIKEYPVLLAQQLEAMKRKSAKFKKISQAIKDGKQVDINSLQEELSKIGIEFDKYSKVIKSLEDDFLERAQKQDNHDIQKSTQKLETLLQEWDEYRDVRKKLIKANAPLILSVMKKIIHKSNEQYLRFIADGQLGLIKAVDTFNPQRDNTFSTYAEFIIKQVMLRELDKYNKGRMTYRAVILEIDKFQKKYYKQKGVNASVQEIHQATGLPIKEIQKALNFKERLRQQTYTEKVDSYILNKQSLSPENIAHYKRMLEFVTNDGSVRLTPNEQFAFQKIKLESLDPEDVARETQFSAKTVAYQARRAVQKIRKAMKNKGYQL